MSDLVFWSETVDDLEEARKALANRIRSISEFTRPNKVMTDLMVSMEKMEAEVVKGLEKEMKTHPLGPWVGRQIGIGNKQAGRLLGIIGDPGDRANVAKLWAYCGYAVTDGEAPRQKRGNQGSYNPKARMRAFLIAESCIKQRHSPYRAVYDHGREKYADAVHTRPCVRCGPSGKPAAVGSSLNDGHKHARALRLVAKEILKDMWVETHT